MKPACNVAAALKDPPDPGRSLWRLSLVTKILLAVGGGYAATAGLVAAGSVLLPFVGLAKSESVVLLSMLCFAIYLVLLLRGFAERRLWRPGAGSATRSGGGFGIASSFRLVA